ncbi:3'-5' exonuclease [Corynebacterium mastitidis]|uniref:3'-5' exonuclease n=1 Tax=Corynebacterium mastitidis TaxID=161890 RepID=UPI000382670E|nr:3'-5' exonuclease [Corynebacterium mastitidis]
MGISSWWREIVDAIQAAKEEYRSQPVFAVVDVETTGFTPSSCRIVEIGVCILDRQFREVSRWETLVNPERKRVGGSDIHGLRVEDLVKAPTFAEIHDQLVDVLDNRVLIAHNAKFDVGFLNAEAKRAYAARGMKPKLLITDIVDSLGLACEAVEQGPYRLAALAQRFGVGGEKLHSAVGDAATVGKVLEQMFGPQRGEIAKRLLKETPSFDKVRAHRLGERQPLLVRGGSAPADFSCHAVKSKQEGAGNE